MADLEKNEMMESLKRSGYLLESQISKILSQNSFFVESNQVIKDPITGKSREIDLIAEYYDFDREVGTKCCAKIKYVFEIKNNDAPIVLMTQFEHSPNIEDWYGLKEYLTIPENINYNTPEVFWEELVQQKRGSIFTQYCSFQKKKGNGELMALHPDNIHNGLSKIVQHCEESIGVREYTEKPDGYLRHFIYLPILLISENLYELRHSDSNEPELTKVDSSMLVYNYHHNDEPQMAYVFVVTKKGFPDFMNSMLKLENDVEKKLIELRKENAT